MTVVFFMDPAGTFDLASLSFHVPICGLWARDTAAPAKHSARVNARVFTFIFFLLLKRKKSLGLSKVGTIHDWGVGLRWTPPMHGEVVMNGAPRVVGEFEFWTGQICG